MNKEQKNTMTNFLEDVGTLRARSTALVVISGIASPHPAYANQQTADRNQPAKGNADDLLGKSRPSSGAIKQPVKQGQSPSRPPTAHP